MPAVLLAAGTPDEPVIQHIKAIGVTNTDILLSYCLVREDIDSLIVKPLATGFKTAALKADEDDPNTRLFTAALRSTWYDATRKRAMEEAEIQKNMTANPSTYFSK